MTANSMTLTSLADAIGANTPFTTITQNSSSSGGSTLSSLFQSSRDLLSTGWSWVKENKKKVVGGTVLTAAVGGYLIYRKVQPMLAQLRQELQTFEQLANQLNPQAAMGSKHAILIHRLEHNLTVGDLTLRQFASTIRGDLIRRFDVDEIRSRMKKSKEVQTSTSNATTTASEQQLLWDEFKVTGFARNVSAVYILALVHALVKLQVSIVSRYVLFDQQAQAQRQEAEAAANPQLPPGQQPPQPVGPPTFLPPAICEEVNRVYFSLTSKHACSIGAAELADIIGALVRIDLAEQPVTGQVTANDLTTLLTRIRTSVERDALGLESKESQSERTESSAASSSTKSKYQSSAVITSATSVQFTSTAPYSRYLLPNSAALSALINSTTFPDPAINNMASFRLAEMVAETNAILNSDAFACTIEASTRAVMDELNKLLIQQIQPNSSSSSSSSQAVPFAQALVAMIKLFPSILPDVPPTPPNNSAASSAANSVASPFFQLLADLPAVKELCAVVYLPNDAITETSPNGGTMNTLNQLTSNKQFAGPPKPTRSGVQIEEIVTSTSLTTPAGSVTSTSATGSIRPLSERLPMQAQLQHAVQDVKGLPVFDRL